MVILEPVQNAGGSFTPPAGYFAGVRDDLRPLRDPALRRRGDHRLRPRSATWFGSERYDIRPDLITCAKGLSSAYAVDRRRDRDRPRRSSRSSTDAAMYAHGITFGGHPVAGARSRSRTSRSCGASASSSTSPRTRTAFRDELAQLLELPIVGDLRGTGYFWALELVKDKETRETFSDDESRVAAARLPLATALRARPDLPRRRPRRPGGPDLAAARRRAAGVRRDRGHPRRRARRGLEDRSS